MIRNEEEFRKELGKYNPAWFGQPIKEKEKYPRPREKMKDLLGELKLRHIFLLTGPRRVGKSVLFKQAMASLIEKGVPAKNILYYSLENPYLKNYCDSLIRDIFEYWHENIAGPGKKYLFLDEIHFAEEWYTQIKVIYDQYDDSKILLSGSSSLVLQKESNLYLKGRYLLHELFPLNFKEFLTLKGKIQELNLPGLVPVKKLNFAEIETLRKKIEPDFKEYLIAGGFPEWFEVKDYEKWFSILRNSISKKSIYEDITPLFRIRNPKILEEIFLFIVANQSKILSYEKINEIAKLKHEILVNYLDYLKSSCLIIEILKFAKNIKEQLKSQKKYLCLDQGLRNASLLEYETNETNLGFVIENVIGLHLYYYAHKNSQKLMYYRANQEVDFVLKDKKALIPIEVKYRNFIPESLPLEEFIQENKCQKGVVVTRSLFKVTPKIIFIPAPVFCLLPFLEWLEEKRA